jgi:hypothetical protein
MDIQFTNTIFNHNNVTDLGFWCELRALLAVGWLQVVGQLQLMIRGQQNIKLF